MATDPAGTTPGATAPTGRSGLAMARVTGRGDPASPSTARGRPGRDPARCPGKATITIALIESACALLNISYSRGNLHQVPHFGYPGNDSTAEPRPRGNVLRTALTLDSSFFAAPTNIAGTRVEADGIACPLFFITLSLKGG